MAQNLFAKYETSSILFCRGDVMINFNYSSDDVVVTEKTKKIGEVLVKFSNIARREGILALEERMDMVDHEYLLADHEIDGVEEKLFGKLLGLVVDGNDASVIECVARYILNTFPTDEKEIRFHLMLIAEGILMIQDGTNPHVMAVILGSMMGLEVGHDFLKEVNDSIL